MRRTVIAVIAIVGWAIGAVAIASPARAIPPPAPTTAGIDLAVLGHDGHSDVYRVPAGVVSPGDAVTIRFRTAADGADAVTLRLTDQYSGEQRLPPMRRIAREVSCYQAVLARNRCDFWQLAVPTTALGVLSYRFIVHRGQGVAYYADSRAQFDALGVGSSSDAPNDYRIHVVSPRLPVIPANERRRDVPDLSGSFRQRRKLQQHLGDQATLRLSRAGQPGTGAGGCRG